MSTQISLATALKFNALVPIRGFSDSKTRFNSTSANRSALVAAMAADTLAALTTCALITQVTVISNAKEVELLKSDQVNVVPDHGEGDLNLAIHRANLASRQIQPTLVLLADLPCLRADALEALLSNPPTKFFVPDYQGDGTTILGVRNPAELQPHFGLNSALKHRNDSYLEQSSVPMNLRIDVDNEADLLRAKKFGLGKHTQQFILQTQPI